MTTLLHTHEGAVPMHTAIEEEVERDIAEDKAVRWEALRALVNTIGARDALGIALTQAEGGRP